MLFSFLQKKEVKTRVGDVPGIIKEAGSFKDINKNFCRIVNDMKASFSALQESITALGAQASDNKYSNTTKNKFCGRALELLGGIAYPESMLAAGDFHSILKERTSGIGSLSVKEFKHLHVFKDNMKAVADTIKAVENNVDSLTKLLNYPVSKQIIRAGTILSECQKLELSIADVSEQMKNISGRITETGNILKEKRNKLQHVMQSSEYVRLDVTRKEIEKLKSDKKIIERKISEEFASVDRIFKKFAHSNTYEKELVNRYINDSFSAFIEDEEGKIKIVLEKMKSDIDSGKIEIEKKKYAKLLDLLRSMSLFESLRQQHKDISRNLESMVVDTDVEKDIKRLESEAESAEQETVRLHKDLGNKSKSRDESVQRLGSLRNDLEDSVSKVLGKKVVLVG